MSGKEKNQGTAMAQAHPDLDPTEILWRDLKRAEHTRRPTNLNELKQRCKTKWDKTPADQCERLTKSHRK